MRLGCTSGKLSRNELCVARRQLLPGIDVAPPSPSLELQAMHRALKRLVS
jgi:hypothetical protein